MLSTTSESWLLFRSEIVFKRPFMLRSPRVSMKYLRIPFRLSAAAKKGTSLAVETEPGVGLRSGLR
jgi:hypothetical protein